MIRNSYLSILGASTAAAMSQHITKPLLWDMGFWPRFGIVTPGKRKPEWIEPRAAHEPRAIENGLRAIAERLPEPHWPQSTDALMATMSDDAQALFNVYNKRMSFEELVEDHAVDNRLKGFYGRLPTHAVKVALILSSLEWNQDRDRPRIEIDHLREAIGIVEDWRAGAHDALIVAGETEQDRWERQILSAIAKSGANGISARDIKNNVRGIHPDALLQVIEQLIRYQQVEEITVKATGAGRPTKRFKTITE